MLEGGQEVEHCPATGVDTVLLTLALRASSLTPVV